MEVVVTTGAIRHTKLQSNRHHQQTNTQFLYGPDALPVTQTIVAEHWRKLYQEGHHRDKICWCVPEKLHFICGYIWTLVMRECQCSMLGLISGQHMLACRARYWCIKSVSASKPVLCQNDCTCCKTFPSIWQGHHSSFFGPTAITKFRGKLPQQRL